ncbi:MAG TPA: hypothetical protein VFG47_05295, partial [Geminicoccaceae bacterium]|nr:hypothetical protein [Geminicoccaceae bacterium]
MPNYTILITHACIRLTLWIEQNGSEVDEVTRGVGVLLYVVHVNNRTKVPRTVKIKGTLPDKPTYCEFFRRDGPFEWKE